MRKPGRIIPFITIATFLCVILAGCNSFDPGKDLADALNGTLLSTDGPSETLPVITPKNGEVLTGYSSGNAGCQVTAPSTKDCFVKLIRSDGIDQIGFYVHAGRTAKVRIPSGYYIAHFAFGETWYGTFELFGRNTTYGSDEKVTPIADGELLQYELLDNNGNGNSFEKLDSSDF